MHECARVCERGCDSCGEEEANLLHPLKSLKTSTQKVNVEQTMPQVKHFILSKEEYIQEQI